MTQLSKPLPPIPVVCVGQPVWYFDKDGTNYHALVARIHSQDTIDLVYVSDDKVHELTSVKHRNLRIVGGTLKGARISKTERRDVPANLREPGDFWHE